MKLRTALVMSIAILAALGTPGVAAGRDPSGVDGVGPPITTTALVATFNKSAVKGLVLVTGTLDGDTDLLRFSLSELSAGDHYQLQGSKARCGRSNTPARTTMTYSFAATTEGDAFRAQASFTHHTAFEDWASFRILLGGSQIACLAAEKIG